MQGDAHHYHDSKWTTATSLSSSRDLSNTGGSTGLGRKYWFVYQQHTRDSGLCMGRVHVIVYSQKHVVLVNMLVRIVLQSKYSILAMSIFIGALEKFMTVGMVQFKQGRQ